MPWGAAIAAGGAIGGSLIGSSSAKKASKAQTKSAREAIALQREMYQQGRADIEPWRVAGTGALQQLAGLEGVSISQPERGEVREWFDPNAYLLANPDVRKQFGAGHQFSPWEHYARYGKGEGRAFTYRDRPEGGWMAKPLSSPANNLEWLQRDPGYQFRMQQGQQALDRSASARGGIYSGRAAKDLLSFGQGLGSQEYGSAWNRLASLANVGQSAAGSAANLGQAFGEQAGQNIMGAGNSRASGYINQANAMGGGLNQLGQIAGYYFGGGGGGGFGGNKPEVNRYNTGTGGGPMKWSL